MKIAICVEELITNALRHGGKAQDIAVSLSLCASGDGIEIEMKDDGPEFDPLAAPPVTGPNPVTGGGIGLAIVNAWGQDAQYLRVEGRNQLKLTLR